MGGTRGVPLPRGRGRGVQRDDTQTTVSRRGLGRSVARGARRGGLGGHTSGVEGGRGRPIPAFTTPTLGILIGKTKLLPI